MEKQKLCLAASAGGHLEEMMNLKKLLEYYQPVLLTEKMKYPAATWVEKIYRVPQVNRKERLCFFKLGYAFLVSLFLLVRERPQAVISIGALATVPVCILAKAFGIRLIYIESFARRYEMSKTGSLVSRFADVTIVQWKELLKVCPNAVYGGMIY